MQPADERWRKCWPLLLRCLREGCVLMVQNGRGVLYAPVWVCAVRWWSVPVQNIRHGGCAVFQCGSFPFSAHFCASLVLFLASSQFLKTFLNVTLPKTLKVFCNQCHRRNKSIDAKPKHGSVTDFSCCHGNAHYLSFCVIWILGVFPGKFLKKDLPTWLDLTGFFHARVHVCLCVQELLIHRHMIIYYCQQPNVVKTIACCPGVSLSRKTFYLLPWCYIFGCFKCRQYSFRFYISILFFFFFFAHLVSFFWTTVLLG